ncbi:MAG: glutamate 5-kinase [Xanthomonadales bacterium]|nr:glutamate 5-kinase [Xanthomonadales bacterium]
MHKTMHRIVVKIGSHVLCEKDGALNEAVLADLVGQLAALRELGIEVLLVSSGAVAAGQGVALNREPTDPVTRRQVLSAAGQVRLMQRYQALFRTHGLDVAQVLACKSDFQTRAHYLNMRQCIEGLLQAGLVPVINENDVVSITELMFTDNDELAGLVAGMVDADLLCLLSSVDGVLDAQGRTITHWDEAQHAAEDVVRRPRDSMGRGGMHGKIATARRAASLGTNVVIAHGQREGVLASVLSGEPVGTRFEAQKPASPVRRWVASAQGHAAGAVHVNQGAADALQDPDRLASLLPVGIERLEGDFEAGDVIRIVGPDGAALGCGRAQYGRADAEPVLGQQGHKPLVHYDYLYLGR